MDRSINNEHYLTPQQLEYFRERLLRLRQEHQRKVLEHTQHLQSEFLNDPDCVDRASTETEYALEIQTFNREKQLVAKIDQALDRIKNGSYGYCEETGEPIGLSRLDAYPVTSLSLEAQTRCEGFVSTPRQKITA